MKSKIFSLMLSVVAVGASSSSSFAMEVRDEYEYKYRQQSAPVLQSSNIDFSKLNVLDIETKPTLSIQDMMLMFPAGYEFGYGHIKTSNGVIYKIESLGNLKKSIQYFKEKVFKTNCSSDTMVNITEMDVLKNVIPGQVIFTYGGTKTFPNPWLVYTSDAEPTKTIEFAPQTLKFTKL